ncbi:hypothetical protein K450DRAFT_243800 [Umbelopsis ramanniana AG]|uniref:Uncharacterized protein n=1 Tax=Umbelopsis ramanniana AG TaxID=1314678 RepID=A0AAD5E8I2_UMBRA|nr:uncharacterized protein K450DRAFT_243800 [Umbelopsis ramanniana AG]KAI8579083.1 hypothetical protein K450DRAFT_243800 [Umbelopsis ramanniana AG]
MVLPEQQTTPRSSQEESHDKELEKELNNLFCEKESPITHNVDWIDTDTDEDEDYLPQNLHHQLPSPPRKLAALDYRTPSPPPSGNKRNRVESMSWSPSSAPGPMKKAMHQFPTAFSPSTQHSRRTVRTVQQAINDAIDNGADMVDLSNMDLTDIPDEIRELQHITILSKDLINNSSLKVFLYGNRLTKLSMELFSLKNLSVLSLRNNKLETIPPEIVLLQNLCELSLGNNLLRYLPGEILRLRKLNIISVLPNPFQTIPQDNTSTPARQIIRSVPTPSLFEICSRAVMASTNRYDNQNMPFRITEHLDASKNVKRCQNCKCYIIQPDIEVMVWCSLLICSNVPAIVGFCSMHCLEACDWNKVGLFAGDINC